MPGRYGLNAGQGRPIMFGKKKRHIARILVVEDEPLVAFDTEHFLTSEGFKIVATVDSVKAALRELAKERQLDLVLLDVELADGDGVEVARAAHARGVPVLFVTARCPENAAALAAGCLAKPHPQRDLVAAIDAIDAVASGGKPPRRLPERLVLFGATA